MTRFGRWHMLALPMLLAVPSSCVKLSYDASRTEEPLPPAAISALQPGRDDLASCLRDLGAPHFVWEYRGNGMALGWVSEDTRNWNVDASYNFDRFTNARLKAAWANSDLPGVVLWFDPDLRLERVRQGRMRDLVQGLKQRPADLSDDDSSSVRE